MNKLFDAVMDIVPADCALLNIEYHDFGAIMSMACYKPDGGLGSYGDDECLIGELIIDYLDNRVLGNNYRNGIIQIYFVEGEFYDIQLHDLAA